MVDGDTRCGGPGVDRHLHPRWHRRGPHASVFSHEIDDTPSSVTLLQMHKCESCHFRSPQSAAKKNREDGAIAQTMDLRDQGALRRAWACRCDSQFPTRMPVDFTLLTRLIPCANSGASNPLSAASAASLRMADILIMIDEDPSPRSSSDTRHALTVALVKPGRGACWNHSINSFKAML